MWCKLLWNVVSLTRLRAGCILVLRSEIQWLHGDVTRQTNDYTGWGALRCLAHLSWYNSKRFCHSRTDGLTDCWPVGSMYGTLTYRNILVAWSWKIQLTPPWWGDFEIRISEGDLGWSSNARCCCGVIGGAADALSCAAIWGLHVFCAVGCAVDALCWGVIGWVVDALNCAADDILNN